jgi:hypothetical protein
MPARCRCSFAKGLDGASLTPVHQYLNFLGMGWTNMTGLLLCTGLAVGSRDGGLGGLVIAGFLLRARGGRSRGSGGGRSGGLGRLGVSLLRVSCASHFGCPWVRWVTVRERSGVSGSCAYLQREDAFGRLYMYSQGVLLMAYRKLR